MKSLYRFLIATLCVFKLVSAKHSPELIITNNGPALLDSNLTFTVALLHYEPRHKLTFSFEDGIRQAERVGKDLNVSASFPFPSSDYEEKSYVMKVTVYSDNYFFKETVVSNTSRFELKNYLIGQMFVYQLKDGQSVDVDEVPVGENILIAISLVDNNHYLENAAIDYSWSVDFEKQRTENNTLVYNFADAGVKDIKGAVTALFPNNDFKYGFFERTVTAKIPVNSINVSGNPFLYHGDTLNLNITCNGTHRSTFTTCKMEIMKYIQEDGKYQVGIYISNNVRDVTRVIEVMVYSVSVNPTLSIIIIPIVCGLLTLVIIALGISYFIQQRRQMAVEVANFDFVDDSDSYTERTFFENIFDSLSCRKCLIGRPCGSPGEVEPLVD
ncbi:hypothetical protein JTE90_006061 [Oedothorax gibbosus]|uniref:Uncharacterized protein n=1 Tax=Oedothorax gibbosus TaxID=931172 RepID=A0AAV6V3U6_9ARAC|nr:hypothetical protein JTE90_006061 [Oedothorax gibbosus]